MDEIYETIHKEDLLNKKDQNVKIADINKILEEQKEEQNMHVEKWKKRLRNRK